MQPTALITGGNSGIGYATAKLFKDNGYDVTITGRDETRLAEAAEKLDVKGFTADMSSVEDIAALANHYKDSPLNVLVNNAGICKVAPLEYLNTSDIEESLNINVRGTMLLTQQLLTSLRKAKGCVINVSSAIVENGVPNSSLYAASKGAIDAFTRNLALELAPDEVRVNAVTPGSIDTPLFGKLGIPETEVNAIREQIKSTIPLQRHGKPEEVAQVIYAQVNSTYVTGSIWTVDGGVAAY